MRIGQQDIQQLSLDAAAKKTVEDSMVQLPQLISERSLAGSEKILATYTKARFSAGHSPLVETLAMPKNGPGPRPVSVLSPEARTLYQALVDRLQPSLPAPSRDGGLKVHKEFGLDEADDAIRIVDFDIAACYEYIDHGILREELAIQSMNSHSVESLIALLGDIYPRRVGIPQAMQASHLLGDAYLNQLERSIVRQGFKVHRYADDFRLIASNRGEAHGAIELAVDMARKIGLVLADGKTQIRSPQRIKDEAAEKEAAFSRYRDEAADDLRSIDFIIVGYEDIEEIEVEADPEAIDYAALTRVVEDWVGSDREERTLHSYFGNLALKVLQNAEDRVENEWLVEIYEREPIRLFGISNYLMARAEAEENWIVLAGLTKTPRQSPWAKLWMARLADSFPATGTESERVVLDWAEGLLRDRHETVRAEAAWILAGHKEIGIDDLCRLYVSASDISKTGIAACAGRLGGENAGRTALALRDESPLTRAAFEWGATFAS